MAKKDRKRKSSQSGLWKKVDVGLPEGAAGEDDNHYDSRGMQNRANKDLEAQPGEETGIFLGLEVIDGSDYRVENRNGSQVLLFKDREQDAASEPADKDKNAAPTIDERAEPKRPKKKRKTKSTKGDAMSGESETVTTTYGATSEQGEPTSDNAPLQKNPKKKKRKNKKKKGKASNAESDKSESNVSSNNPCMDSEMKTTASDAAGGADIIDHTVDEATISRMQTAWMSQTGGVTLHDEVCKSLIRQDFWTPTPIQAGCLPAAILGRRNIVGAAPTGSGKTLAFLLPIYQTLLEEADKVDEEDAREQQLKALVLTPTRELAKQIVAECDKLGRGRAALVVGGLAHVKQKRLLSRRPPIIVATPGRLWEMVRPSSSLTALVQG